MCFGCYAFSAMTLLTPGPDAVPSNIPEPINRPSDAIRVTAGMDAEQIRIQVNQLIDLLPADPDAQVLREELLAIQSNLNGVNDAQQALYIVDEGLLSMAMRVRAADNVDDVLKIFYQIQEQTSQSSNLTSFLGERMQSRWGWLT